MPLLVQSSDITMADLQPDLRIDRPCTIVGEIERVWEADDHESTNMLVKAVEASDATQVGRVHVEVLRHSAATEEKNRHVRHRLLRFSLALGLASPEHIAANSPIEPDFEKVLGQKAVFAINRRKYRHDDGKMLSSLQVGFLDKSKGSGLIDGTFGACYISLHAQT